jgi:signal transduction histidine kinase
MQSTHQSREDTFRSSDFRGLPVFLRASQLTPGNWRLLLQLDQEHALYNFSSVRNSLIAATCGVGLLAVLLNVMIAKGLFAPVTPILVTLKNLSEGFLYSRASVGRKDQFGQFATELNRLAESYENEVTENRGLAQEIELLRSERKETAQTFLINENRRVTELKPKHTPVNLNDVISEACDRIVPLCDLKNVEFEIILDNDGLSLEIDQQQIQSMLIDLLRRAVEGSDEFSTIVLKTHIKDGRLQLLIKDWGAVEQAPYPMLERYREVLQQQDAELHFNSRVGVGNTIFIEFPKERSIGRQANFYA